MKKGTYNKICRLIERLITEGTGNVDSAQSVVNYIIKKNKQFRWLPMELPTNYTLRDVQNVLNKYGYGQVYDRAVSVVLK